MKDNENSINLVSDLINQYQKELISINRQVTDIQKTIFDDNIFDDYSISLLNDIISQCKMKRKNLRIIESPIIGLSKLYVESNELTKLADRCVELIERYETVMFKASNMKLVVNRIMMDKDTYSFKNIIKETINGNFKNGGLIK